MIWGTFNNGEPRLRVSVTLPGITVGSVAIDVVIDTGATHTCVHPFDAMFKLGIDPMLLTTPGLLGPVWKLSGVGGTADYQVHQAHYEFLHEDSRSAVRTNERIYIAVPTPENDTLPSLLGMDLLQHFTLHMDYRNGVLTLDE